MRKFLVALLALVPLIKADTAVLPTLNAPFSNDLRAAIVASGLNFPTAMAIAPKGGLLVGTTAPAGDPGQFNYYLGQGQLLNISGGNTVQVASFPGAITAVATIGSVLLQIPDSFRLSAIANASSPMPNALPTFHCKTPRLSDAGEIVLSARPGCFILLSHYFGNVWSYCGACALTRQNDSGGAQVLVLRIELRVHVRSCIGWVRKGRFS
jgi:hypothetical protein